MIGCYRIFGDEQFDDLGGPGGRKLPIGIVLGGVNGDVIRMAFDAHAQLAGADYLYNLVQGGNSLGPQGGGAAV